MVTVSTLTSANKQNVQELNELMVQLRHDHAQKTSVTLSELKAIVKSQNMSLAVAKDGTRIVGVALLVIVQRLGKRAAYIEDVVVDSTYRGEGFGEKIVRKLIAIARAEKVRTIGLTSRPARIAGNKLYQKLGFEKKETNVYRLKLCKSDYGHRDIISRWTSRSTKKKR